MDTVEKVAPKRGRPKKEDPATPVGEYQAKQAQEFRESLGANPIVDKYYVLQGYKLRLIKKKKSGREISEYVGSIEDRHDASDDYKANRQKLLAFIKRKEAEGKLKRM